MEKKPKPNKFGITPKLHQINKIKEFIKNNDELKTQIEEAKKERKMRNKLDLQQSQKKHIKYYKTISRIKRRI